MRAARGETTAMAMMLAMTMAMAMAMAMRCKRWSQRNRDIPELSIFFFLFF
jgi:hypothetical protein